MNRGGLMARLDRIEDKIDRLLAVQDKERQDDDNPEPAPPDPDPPRGRRPGMRLPPPFRRPPDANHRQQHPGSQSPPPRKGTMSLRKFIFAALLALGATTAAAAPVLACGGYWSCTEHEYGYECYWIGG